MLMLTLQRTVEAVGAWTALALTECMAGEEGRRSNPALKVKQTMKKKRAQKLPEEQEASEESGFTESGVPGATRDRRATSAER